MEANAMSMAGELRTIDRRALEMARSVLSRPDARQALAQEAEALAARLAEIARTLAAENPVAHRAMASVISEAGLDLRYVRAPVQIMSLRLGRRYRALRRARGAS